MTQQQSNPYTWTTPDDIAAGYAFTPESWNKQYPDNLNWLWWEITNSGENIITTDPAVPYTPDSYLITTTDRMLDFLVTPMNTPNNIAGFIEGKPKAVGIPSDARTLILVYQNGSFSWLNTDSATLFPGRRTKTDRVDIEAIRRWCRRVDD